MKSLTNREKLIYAFVENYKSITIDQCSKIFMRNLKQKYVIASKCLQKMVELKYFNVGKIKYTNANVYYIDKKLSFHDLTVIQYCAELINIGATDVRIETNKNYSNLFESEDEEIDFISDGFIYFKLNRKEYIHLVEVAFWNKNVKLKDYENLIQSNVIQENYGVDNISLVIINTDDFQYKSEIVKTHTFNYDFNDIYKMFI